jgi:hypothetical protein
VCNFTISTQITNPTPTNAGANVWVAVGEGTNTLAYSYDGIQWTGLGTTIFSNDAISIASGYFYNGGLSIGPFVVAIGTSANSTNTAAYTTDGVNWAGFGKSGFGFSNIDSSCKIVFLYDLLIVFGGGTFNDIRYLPFGGSSWVTMGSSFSNLNMAVTGLCWFINGYYAVGTGTTNTLAFIQYSGAGAGTGSGTFSPWAGLGKTIFTGSGIGIASISTAGIYWPPIAIGTTNTGSLIVSFSSGSPTIPSSYTTVYASSLGIGLTGFTGINLTSINGSMTWLLIYGTNTTNNGNTLYYTNNYTGIFNSSSTFTGTLGNNIFYNGTSSTCTYALLGTGTLLGSQNCAVTTGGNMTVGGNISCGTNATIGGNLNASGNVFVNGNSVSTNITTGSLIVKGGVGISGNISIGGNIFCSAGIAYVGSIQNTSDYRIKANIELLGSDFTVSKLVPVKYYNKLLRKDDVGFIAHEVQEIFPQFVDGEKDGEDYQSVNYTGIIAILVKEIQQLKQENLEIRQELREIRQKLP